MTSDPLTETATIDKDVRDLVAKKEAKTAANEAKKTADREYKAAEAALWSRLEDLGLKTLSGDFGRVSRAATTYGQVDDLATAIESLKAEGLGETHTKTVLEDARINELVRQRLEDGQELPDGITHRDQQYISVSRAD